MLKTLSTLARNNKAIGRVALACIPDARWKVRIDPIGPFEILLRRDRRFWLRHPLIHERAMFGGIQRLLRPGDVVYDIGANLGLYARFFIQAFGASSVIAFEPMAQNRQTLLRNLQLGGIDSKVRVFPHAVSDSTGEEALQIDQMGSATAALSRVTGGAACETHRQFGLEGKTEQVRTTTLDEIVRSEALPPPGLIKIDVEGAEGMVLSGALGTIERHKPRLAVELHGPDKARQVMPVLAGLGYHLYAHGFVNGRSWWGHAGGDDAKDAVEQYHFAFVFASMDREDFARPIEPYTADQAPASR